MWMAIGAVALIGLTVLFIALLSPRSEGPTLAGGQFAPEATVVTGTPNILAATVETDPVPHSEDAADDVAIWIHPTDTSLSTVIGTDKLPGGGLGVYDLSGKQLYFYFDGDLNNVDLRYNFPLGGTAVSLVGVANRTPPVSILFYWVNPTDRSLVKAGAIPLAPVGIDRARGFAMYRSPVSGKYHAFVTDFGTNVVAQFELDGSTGTVTGTLVRSFDAGDSTEGLAADDDHQRLYVSEEDVGVWVYGAEPEAGEVRTLVDSVTSSGGHLTPNVKNSAIYRTTGGGGYLIVSNQGASNFAVYERTSHAFLGTFDILSGNGVDGVGGQDGIEVTNFPLGDAFAAGVFVSQDHINTDAGNGNSGNQNYKLIPWQLIANSFDVALGVDRSFDPRQPGSLGAPP
jgi:myo-inositol-hexaphosphate 3-phosphohydrolase